MPSESFNPPLPSNYSFSGDFGTQASIPNVFVTDVQSTTTISELPEASTVERTDLIVLQRGDNTYAGTINDLIAIIGSESSFVGDYDASVDMFPSTGGTGTGGAILMGNYFRVSEPGTIGGTPVFVNTLLLALVNIPGQTVDNWAIIITGTESFNGRQGAVIPQTGDYNISQITNGLSNALLSSRMFVGNVSNVATGVAMSGDGILSNTGALTVNYLPPYMGAVLTTMVSKFSQTVSVADFGAVGDGVTDDTAAIQAAVNSTSNALDFVHGLTYLISAPIIGKSQLLLRGNKCTLLAANQTMTSMLNFNVSSSVNIYISDFIFNGQGTFSTVFSNGNNAIVTSSSPRNINVLDCVFTGCLRGGLFQTGSVYNIINCYAYNNGESGFSFNQCDKVKICMNTVDNILGNNALPPQYADGIFIDSCTNVVVDGNIISRCVRDGIVFESSASQCKNITVVANSINGLSGSINGQSNTGIYVDGGATDGSIVIANNAVTVLNTWSGITASGIVSASGGVITGNRLYGAKISANAGAGIQCQSGTHIVSDNYIEGFGSGIINATNETTSTYKYTIKDNYIFNNNVYGILFSSNSLVDIRDNELIDNGINRTILGNNYAGAGIRLTSGTTWTPRAIIADNVFQSSANEGDTTGQLYGIISSRTGGTAPTILSLSNNFFNMTGTFSTSYPNGTTLPVCFGADAGGGSIVTFRDFIGDNFNNLCTKAPTNGVVFNSPSGFQRYIGQASAAPSGSVPASVGDIYLNNSVSANSNLMWVCTVAGTPGTWQQAGFINSTPNIKGGATNSLPYQSAANTTAMLSANATATTKFLSQVSSGAPSWLQPATANLSDVTLNQSWTPVDASGGGLTFSSVSGANLTRFGKITSFTATITYPVTVDTNQAIINGLLVSANAQTIGQFFVEGAVQGAIRINGPSIYFYNTTGTHLNNNTLSGLTIQISGTYSAA